MSGHHVGEKCSKNEKLSTAHLAVSERRLSKLLSNLDEDFQRSSQRLRKETDDIKRDLFQLRKQKGSLCASTLHGLEASPGIQDRFTRNKRFGCYDPALNKASTDIPKEDKRKNSQSTWERKKEVMVKNAKEKLQSVPISPVELLSEDIDDPYKRNLQRLLDNSKLAKDIRSTSLKVKSLDSICKGQQIARRDSAVKIPASTRFRQRIHSLPPPILCHEDQSSESSVRSPTGQNGSTKTSSQRSISWDGALNKHSGAGALSITPKSQKEKEKKTRKQGEGRVRKRSSSLTLPPLSGLSISQRHTLRRQSGPPINEEGGIQ